MNKTSRFLILKISLCMVFLMNFHQKHQGEPGRLAAFHIDSVERWGIKFPLPINASIFP